jgi:hypothetical protein
MLFKEQHVCNDDVTGGDVVDRALQRIRIIAPACGCMDGDRQPGKSRNRRSLALAAGPATWESRVMMTTR